MRLESPVGVRFSIRDSMNTDKYWTETTEQMFNRLMLKVRLERMYAEGYDIEYLPSNSAVIEFKIRSFDNVDGSFRFIENGELLSQLTKWEQDLIWDRVFHRDKIYERMTPYRDLEPQEEDYGRNVSKLFLWTGDISHYHQRRESLERDGYLVVESLERDGYSVVVVKVD